MRRISIWLKFSLNPSNVPKQTYNFWHLDSAVKPSFALLEVRQIQTQRRMSQEHPMAADHSYQPPPQAYVPEPSPPAPNPAPVSSAKVNVFLKK